MYADVHNSNDDVTGMFEWDRNLFPYAPGSSTTSTGANRSAENPIVTWLRNRSLSTYLDVHQCPGVWPENTNYAKVAKAMGMTDQQIADKENIRVLVENRTFNREFFNTLLQDQVGDNVYYWIDLCMGAEGYTKLPLWRFNWPLWNLWMFYNDMERRTGQHSILTKSTIPPAFSFVYCYVHGCTGTVAPPSGPSGVIRIELIATSCYLQCMLMRARVCVDAHQCCMTSS